MKHAVLVIDMNKDFVTGKLKCERALKIIPNIDKLIKNSRKQGNLVIFASDAHFEDDPELRVWGEHGMAGTEGAEVIPELKIEESDHIIEKRTYSAFYKTGLNKLLEDNGVSKVIITGLHTNICDRHTAADAFFRGYEIIVAKDCVEAFSDKDQGEGLDYLKKVYGAKIKSVNEIISN
jgi:nicotinamidase-related amidase|tara:strand:- start:137 stop:670 length:534 start_codon:yes stop_codon:yes gene_type:complete